MKKNILLVFIGLTILLGGGCMDKTAQINQSKNKMINAVNKKYEEVFIPIEFISKNWAYEYEVLIATPKEASEKKFRIEMYKGENGEDIIKDGYFGVLIKKEYEELIATLFLPISKEIKIFTDFGNQVFSNDLNKGTKIEKIYENDKLFFANHYIYIPRSSLGKDEFDELILKDLGKLFIDKKLVGKVDFYLVEDEAYNALTEESYQKLGSNPSAILDNAYFTINKELEYFDYELGDE